MATPRHPHLPVLAAAIGAGLAVGAACGPAGSAPELQPVEDRIVAVGQEVVVLLAATDRDGDELRYSFSAEVPDIDARGRITHLPLGAGEFRWTPLASDVGLWPFDFTVSDGHHTDTVTALIDVRSAVGENSAPRFLHPQGMGTTLNLDRDSCIAVELEVVDSDSAEVRLEELEPRIEGAELTQTSGLGGQWRWCPSAQQVAADDRYTVHFAADDFDNPRTVHPYLIVLRRPSKPDCPGEPPVVAHSPADLSSLVGLTLRADVSDDKGLKREPLLYYSTTRPANPPDLASMIQVSMELESGTMKSGRWRARVPNPVAGLSTGATRQLYYVIVAVDDDDPVGSCDHLTQAPASGAFQMTITNPGGAGGAPLCEPCTHDVQCGGASDLCVRVGTGSDAYCLGSCTSSSQCPSGTTCSSAAITSVEGKSGRQCVPLSSDCSDPGGAACEDDDWEDNDTLEQALSRPLLGKGTHDLVSCPAASGTGDDEDFFAIAVHLDTQLRLRLEGGSNTDLDLALYTASGSLIASSVSFTSIEEITACLTPGTYVIRVFAWGTGRNPYKLTVQRTVQSCGPVCEDDENEDDDNAGQARATNIWPSPHVSTTQAICSGDDDWYRVELFNSEILVVDLTFEQTSSAEDLDIHLYAANGTTNLTPCSPEQAHLCDLGNGQSGTSNEHFEWQAPSSGCAPCTRYVVVRGFDGSENLYDISIGVK
jgi:hypothetical protein